MATATRSSNSLYGVKGEGGRGGVYGKSGSGLGVYGSSKTGNGVYGWSGTKTGVRGIGKFGVYGRARTDDGIGVYGSAAKGTTGVYARATGTKAALHVNGRSRFKQSGVTVIRAGETSKVVPLTFTLAPGSLVVATLQTNAGSGVAVRTARTYGSDKIRITLTGAVRTQLAAIAYFIFTP